MTKDITGKTIVNNDVVMLVATGQVMLVSAGSGSDGQEDLGVFNSVLGYSDRLDVYPDGVLKIIGNMADRDHND